MADTIQEIDKKDAAAAARLKNIIQEGGAEIFLILGPPRCGTTATEKYLLNLDVDGQINEPLVAQEGRTRYIINSKQTIIDKIDQLHAQGIRKPRLIIKHTSRFIPLDGEIEFWKDISKHILVLVRNPALNLESYLQAQMEAFSTKELTEHHQLEKLFSPAETENLPNSSKWKRYLENAKGSRNYSGLQDTFIYSKLDKASEFWLNPAHAKGVLRLCIDLLKKERGEAAVAMNFSHSMYKTEEGFWNFINKRNELSVEVVPEFLLDALIAFRSGHWVSMDNHYQALKSGTTPYTVVDFSDIQLDPSGMLKQIAKRFDIGFRQEGTSARTQFSNDGAGKIWANEFDPFGTVNKYDTIQPPSKTPIALSKYPPFMQDAMPAIFRIYSELLCDTNRIVPPALSAGDKISMTLPSGKVFHEVDPVGAYAFLSATAKPSAVALARLKNEYKDHMPYFEMIDDIHAHKTSTMMPH